MPQEVERPGTSGSKRTYREDDSDNSDGKRLKLSKLDNLEREVGQVSLKEGTKGGQERTRSQEKNGVSRRYDSSDSDDSRDQEKNKKYQQNSRGKHRSGSKKRQSYSESESKSTASDSGSSSSEEGALIEPKRDRERDYSKSNATKQDGKGIKKSSGREELKRSKNSSSESDDSRRDSRRDRRVKESERRRDRERGRPQDRDRGRTREYRDHDRNRVERGRDYRQERRDYDRYRDDRGRRDDRDRDRDSVRNRGRDRYRESSRDRGGYSDRDRSRHGRPRDHDASRSNGRDDQPASERRAKDTEKKGGERNEKDQGNKGPQELQEAKPKVKLPTMGAYIPPFKLAMLQAQMTDKQSDAYQRVTWDSLRKSLQGIVNKVNANNIKPLLLELFAENLVRGRGLIVRALMKAQLAFPTFSNVYAALAAVLNTKFPEIGELLLHRVVLQFKKAFKRGDKDVCSAAVTFIAHLTNQCVVAEGLALQVALQLLEEPSEESVAICVTYVKHIGQFLKEECNMGLVAISDRLRAILQDGQIQKNTQYVVEGLLAVYKTGFEAAGFPRVAQGLDLVEESDQITHVIDLQDTELKAMSNLDFFKVDPDYEQHEKEWAEIKKEVLGESEDEDSGEEGSGESDEDDDDDSSDEEAEAAGAGGAGGDIIDKTGTDLVNLRRVIYLTIMSSMDFEETGHKLMKIKIPEGQEAELVAMIIECCSQEKTFLKYYALLAGRFCMIGVKWRELFEMAFETQYSMCDKLETNKLRNIANMYAMLLSSDSLSWRVLSLFQLTEDNTTAAQRIFIKFILQNMSEWLGMRKMKARLNDPECQEWFAGLFPTDSPKSMRFAINFFVSIGLGALSDTLRKLLQQLPQLLAERQAAAAAAAAANRRSRRSRSDSESSSGSDASDSSGSSGSSGTQSSDSR